MNCTEEFIAKMKQKDIVINFVQAWRNDTLEESYARLDKPTRLHAYSVSKSVTSIGVGLAAQEGLLRLDDPVLRFYPEYDPAELAPNLRRMTVRDLLKMGCGSKDKMFFWNDAQRLQCRDWQDYFLRNAFPYEPGTRFEYNNFKYLYVQLHRGARCGLHPKGLHDAPRFLISWASATRTGSPAPWDILPERTACF